MERYLLFDAGCAVCHQLAQAIEEAAAGKLEALSIRDPQAREWLDRAYPDGWAHQPYLVTVDGDRVQASAGMGMALRLGRLLGPRQGWRVWNLARQSGIPLSLGVGATGEQSAFAPGRRTFLKTALGTVIATAASLLFDHPILEFQEAHAQSPCSCFPWWCGCVNTLSWSGCMCENLCATHGYCTGGCNPDYYVRYECLCGPQCGLIRYCMHVTCDGCGQCA